MEFWNNLSLKLRNIFIGSFIVVLLLAGFFLYPKFSKSQPENSPQDIVLPNELPQMSVYVTGAVERPGVYTLPHGSRVKDALKIAGTKKDWDPEGINLAKRLEDEDMVVVPRAAHQGEAKEQTPLPGSAIPRPLKPKLNSKQTISLNKASVADLEALPGVGPGMAKRILDYRLAHGSFGSVDDVRDIPGLGEKKFQKMKPFLRL